MKTIKHKYSRLCNNSITPSGIELENLNEFGIFVGDQAGQNGLNSNFTVSVVNTNETRTDTVISGESNFGGVYVGSDVN